MPDGVFSEKWWLLKMENPKSSKLGQFCWEHPFFWGITQTDASTIKRCRTLPGQPEVVLFSMCGSDSCGNRGYSISRSADWDYNIRIYIYVYYIVFSCFMYIYIWYIYMAHRYCYINWLPFSNCPKMISQCRLPKTSWWYPTATWWNSSRSLHLRPGKTHCDMIFVV